MIILLTVTGAWPILSIDLSCLDGSAGCLPRRFLIRQIVKMAVDTVQSVVKKFYNEYMETTSKKLKIIDAYLFYILLTGVMQFGYCVLVGTFPFNSFLSGFISCVGSFVLAGNKSNLADNNYCKYKVLAVYLMIENITIGLFTGT